MHRPRARIFSSFTFLNVAQFCGALNDNIFKLVIVFLLIGLWGKDASNLILSLSGVVFVLPFLLFSLPAGTLADRYSKRNITVFTKVMEVVVMSLGVWAFAMRSAWGSYAILFLMATQSAIFGPSKYGIIPELVRRDQISQANGILTGLTVLATIVGTFFAAFLTSITDYDFVAVAWICVGISAVGLAASICIEKTPALGIKRKLVSSIVLGVFRVIKRTRQENYLFVSLLGSSYFFMVGTFTQLNIITYAIQSLGLTDVQGGYLFLVAAGGIAIGAFAAGRICGKKVELGISTFASLGVALFFLFLLIFQHSLALAVTALAALGLFGGLYLVPFDAYIQAASPDSERGENIAVSNFLSFVGVLLASLFLYLLGDLLHLSGAQAFACMALITFVMSIGLVIRLPDTFVRVLSRLNFHRGKHLRVKGMELISLRAPTVYITLVAKWTVGLLTMITIQQRYMRFLMERPDEPLTGRLKWLARLSKVAFYEGPAPTAGSEGFAAGARWIRRGYSLTVIPLSPPTAANLAALEASCREMCAEKPYDLLQATIRTTAPPALGHVTPDVLLTVTEI